MVTPLRMVGRRPLELLDRQIDPRPAQGPERLVKAILRHQPVQVLVVAAGDLEQLPVGALRLRIDRAPDESEEVGVPVLESAAQDLARFGHGDRPTEMGREPRQEAGARDRPAEGLGAGPDQHQDVGEAGGIGRMRAAATRAS